MNSLDGTFFAAYHTSDSDNDRSRNSTDNIITPSLLLILLFCNNIITMRSCSGAAPVSNPWLSPILDCSTPMRPWTCIVNCSTPILDWGRTAHTMNRREQYCCLQLVTLSSPVLLVVSYSHNHHIPLFHLDTCTPQEWIRGRYLWEWQVVWN